MSQTLSTVAKEEFDSEVKHAYQGKKTLRDTITQRLHVVGGKYDFRVMGKGIATQRGGPSVNVTPMNISHGLKTAILSDWEAPEYTDVYNDQKVNFSEVKELANTVAGAMGRRDDQCIIDEALAHATRATDNYATFNLKAITEAAEMLNAKDVPVEDRTFVIDEKGLNDILNDPTITSADYNTVRLLQSGQIDTFMGFKWKIIPSGRGEGGLHNAFYAYHKQAVGMAVGIDIKTEVNYIPEKTSWLTNGLWSAGAVLIDEDGVIKIPHVFM